MLKVASVWLFNSIVRWRDVVIRGFYNIDFGMVCTPSERFGLPRSRKIIKADAYASALRMRICARSQDFALHHLAHRTQKNTDMVSENWAQLGLVVPKRLAKHAVRRNLLKRLIRESFRVRASQLPAGLWVVRLNTNVNNFSIMTQQRKRWAAQLNDLWDTGKGFSDRLRLGKIAAVAHRANTAAGACVKEGKRVATSKNN